jgi:hypothetical protein
MAISETFLAYTVLPGGETLGQRLLPEVEQAVRSRAFHLNGVVHMCHTCGS